MIYDRSVVSRSQPLNKKSIETSCAKCVFTSLKYIDDTNLFASARDLKNLETLINSELGKVKVWCDVNKLSINFIKTNYMIIKSNRKASGSIEVKLQNIDGSSYLLQ